jgi:hypothetical protein
LDSLLIKQDEDLTMQSLWLLNRLFVNKFDVIYTFGEHSLVSFDTHKEKWNYYSFDKTSQIDYQKIFQDSLGNIWFQIPGQGIFYTDNNTVKKLDFGFKNIEYWQIDNKDNLIIISNDTLLWYKITNLKSNSFFLLKTVKVTSNIYSLNRIHTILHSENNLIIINTEGYYIFDLYN